jgi:hypothetical protein
MKNKIIIKNKIYYKNLSYKDLYKEYSIIRISTLKNQKLFYNNISSLQFANISVFCEGFIPWQKNFGMDAYPRVYSIYKKISILVNKRENDVENKKNTFTAEDFVNFKKLEIDKATIGYEEFSFDHDLKEHKRRIARTKNFAKKCEKYNKYKIFI